MRKFEKILLINPLGDEENYGFSLGVAYLSSILKKNGRKVALLDFVNIRNGEPSERLKKAIKCFSPDVVGFSIQNMSYNFSKNLISFLSDFYPGVILMGGPEVTVRETIMDDIPEADMAILGEGEKTFIELLECMDKNDNFRNINGLSWRNNDKVIKNNPREPIKDLDSLPFPDFDIYGVESFDKYPIITSRGCPFSCSFCSSSLGRAWRKRSPMNVLNEMKMAIDRYKIKLFQFVDASFNLMPQRVIEICDLMIQEKINIPWTVQGMRADKITDQLVEKMKKSGCRRLYVGIESFDKDVYEEIGKRESINEIKRGIKIAKKSGIEVYGYLIMGLPKDSFRKTMVSFREAEKLDLNVLSWTSAVPYTGTRLQEWVDKNARKFYASTEVSITGTKYADIAFDTEDFSYRERVLAKKILRVKSGSYHRNIKMSRMSYWLEKIYLLLRYDWRFLPKRIVRSLKFRLRASMMGSIDAVLQNDSAIFIKTPDGTWGLREGDSLPKDSERIILKLNSFSHATSDKE